MAPPACAAAPGAAELPACVRWLAGVAGGGGDAENQANAQRTPGQGKKKKNKQKSPTADLSSDDDEEDLGQGEMTEPTSELGQLLMGNSKVELSMAMAAGRDVSGTATTASAS